MWLIQDYSGLLPQVQNGFCENGKPFAELSASEFACCQYTSRVGQNKGKKLLNCLCCFFR